MPPRPSPRKLLALLLLALWGLAAIWLALTEQDSILLAAAVVALGVLLLVALRIGAEVSRLRHRLLRVAESVREGSRHGRKAAEGTHALEARVESMQRGLDAMNAGHAEATEALRGELGEVLTSSSQMAVETKAFGSKVRATMEGFDAVVDRLGALEKSSDRQDETLGQLRSDIEWLEDILSGQANSLQQLTKGRPLVPASRPATPERVRTLVPRPGIGRTGSSRRINALLEGSRHDTRYLEIGLDEGFTFEDVEATERWGVDPCPRFAVTDLPDGVHVFVTTSDAFFAGLDSRVTFDLVFLDGLREYMQAYHDLLGALAHGAPGSRVLVDGVVPPDGISAIPNLGGSLDERRDQRTAGPPWDGDVFRLVAVLHDHHPELEYRTIVGKGNGQLLVWRREPHVAVSTIPAAALRAYEQLSVADVFRNGIPDYFKPTSEGEAITASRAQEID